MNPHELINMMRSVRIPKRVFVLAALFGMVIGNGVGLHFYYNLLDTPQGAIVMGLFTGFASAICWGLGSLILFSRKEETRP